MSRAFVLAMLLASCGAARAAPERVAALDELAWLLGDWQLPSRGCGQYERWTRVSSSRYVGSVGVSCIRAEQVNETLALEQRGDEIVYIMRSRRTDAVLVLTASSRTAFVAESSTVGESIRVEYRLVSPDTIEETVDEPGRTFTLTLTSGDDL